MLVDVHGAFVVREEEFAIAESEHAEGFEFLDAGRDGADVGCFSVGNGEGLFLVEGHDFNATGGGDGE